MFSIKRKIIYSLSVAFAVSVLLVMGGASRTEAAALTISKTSATISKGSSITLRATKDGKAVTGAVWGSSDPSVATVSGNGKVTGKLKGSAVISAMYEGSTAECLVSVVNKASSKTVRYNVLVIDRSGSMSGAPMRRTKEAAKRFAKTVMNADGTNYVAVVSYGSKSSVACKFTTSYKKVSKAIGKISAKGHTNMRASFEDGNALLKKAPSGKNVIKNLILCSDGLPETGKTKASGRYKKKDHKDYKYANSVYALDKKMKNRGYFIYALGFFHKSSGKDLKFGKRLMKDLASKDKYYVIQDSKDLTKSFDQIADQITALTLSETSITIKVGQKKSLTAYLNGIKADAEWTSDNTSIATVSAKGVVKGIKTGTCRVTATANGAKAVCKVKVIPKDITKDFLLYGDAVRLDDGSIRLTKNQTWLSGSAWYPKAVNTSGQMTISFQYWAGGGWSGSGTGADGIVLNLSEKTGLGGQGEEMGFAGYYGVELDSYPFNSGDPSGRHVAIVKDDIHNHLTYALDERTDDSKWHTVKIVYKSQTLTVYLDGTKILTQSGVVLKNQTYLGLSAATGSCRNEQKIREFKIL